jgi:hypothetical protein
MKDVETGRSYPLADLLEDDVVLGQGVDLHHVAVEDPGGDDHIVLGELGFFPGLDLLDPVGIRHGEIDEYGLARIVEVFDLLERFAKGSETPVREVLLEFGNLYRGRTRRRASPGLEGSDIGTEQEKQSDQGKDQQSPVAQHLVHLQKAGVGVMEPGSNRTP